MGVSTTHADVFALPEAAVLTVSAHADVDALPEATVLTVSAHADVDTLPEATVLAAVAVEADDEALPISKAAVLDLLLDAAPEETLQTKMMITMISLFKFVIIYIVYKCR